MTGYSKSWMNGRRKNMNDMEMLSALMQPPKPKDIRKLLCVQPHPDDNELGLGGTIQYLVSKGVQVDYLTVTDGGLGDIGLTDGSKPLTEIRKREAVAAGRHLGVSEFYFLNHGDATLSDIPSLAGEIAEILRKGQYDAVAAPDPWNLYEAHNDHIVTGRATAQAAISSSLRCYPEGTDTPPVNLRAVFFYFTAKPNTFIDTTEYFQRKMEAVAMHRSQMSAEMLQLYGGYFAWRGRCQSGDGRIMEGVKALAPLHLHCIPEALDI